MYGKLIDGVLHRAPKMLHIGSNNVWSPADYPAGWKEIV